LIVVDTSAVIAILRSEEERDRFLETILDADHSAISATSILECSIVFRSFKHLSADHAETALTSFVSDTGLAVEPFTSDDLRFATDAHMRFGKGTGHGAALNFGDCISYGLARRLNAPLLYKGGDFAKTDITSAL
jgi:ribonuclease VapC